jgi:hypothetical protein
MLSRQPNDVVQVNLRIKEHERRKLEAAAKANRTTLNGEIAGRVMRTFETEQLLTAEQVAENINRYLAPLVGDLHLLNVSNSYRQAVGKLLALIRPLVGPVIKGETGEAITAVLAEIDQAAGLLDREVASRVRRSRTKGVD